MTQASNGVICVQNQLKASGYFTGIIDGLISTKLLNSVENLVSIRNLKVGFTFDYGTADSYCRRIGLDDPLLKLYWTSLDRPIKFYVGNNVPDSIAHDVKKYAKQYFSSTVEKLGLELASTDKVLISDHPGELRRMLADVVDYEVENLYGSLMEICSAETGVGGRTLPGVLYICINSRAKKGAGVDTNVISFLLAHEFIHLIQFQVSGSRRFQAISEDISPAEGPVWMQEGFPQAIALAISSQYSFREVRDFWWRRFSQTSLPDLFALEQDSALSNNPEGVYLGGAVAAAELLDRFGYLAYGRFLDQIGIGEHWAVAFERSFSLTPTKFYSDFSAMSP